MAARQALRRELLGFLANADGNDEDDGDDDDNLTLYRSNMALRSGNKDHPSLRIQY